ncbi:MAG: hypothetical protein ACO1Q7_04445 [Gemmatimonas sp.]
MATSLRLIVASLAAGAATIVATLHAQPQSQSRSHADLRASLLAADRAFASKSAGTDLVSGLTASFADSITLIALGEQFHGVAAAREALNRNAENAKSSFRWSPIQGDVSNDGQTGYTLGFTTWKRPDGTEVPGKYVAFWTKQRGEWRVLVYKRTGRGAGDVSTAEEGAPLHVGATQKQFTSADSMRFARELDAAERAFSDDAAKTPLGAAFIKQAAPDAHHTGAATDADFRRGPKDIGAGISAGGDPPLGSISWAPDKVHVAKSGDIGITYGVITLTQPNAAARRVAYLTVWKRSAPDKKWQLAVE